MNDFSGEKNIHFIMMQYGLAISQDKQEFFGAKCFSKTHIYIKQFILTMIE
jgi:hypothetical protein